MTDRGSDTFLATVVECYDTTVAQRQLKFTLTLLTSYFACYRTVYFIRQPVFASYSFKLQYIRQIFMKFRQFIFRHFIMTFHCFVYHVCLGRRTEHLFYGKVERTHAVSLLESETMITGCFTDYVHRSTFTFGNLTYVFDCFFFYQQPHTFLTFISDDFFG